MVLLESLPVGVIGEAGLVGDHGDAGESLAHLRCAGWHPRAVDSLGTGDVSLMLRGSRPGAPAQRDPCPPEVLVVSRFRELRAGPTNRHNGINL